MKSLCSCVHLSLPRLLLLLLLLNIEPGCRKSCQELPRLTPSSSSSPSPTTAPSSAACSPNSMILLLIRDIALPTDTPTASASACSWTFSMSTDDNSDKIKILMISLINNWWRKLSPGSLGLLFCLRAARLAGGCLESYRWWKLYKKRYYIWYIWLGGAWKIS